MSNKWLDKHPMVDPNHVHELETRAAALEFKHRMPRDQAEEQAHKDYHRNQAIDAAAHHLLGAAAARAANDDDVAGKHGEAYANAAEAAGFDPMGKPDPEILKRMKSTPAKIASFKSHAADELFAKPEPFNIDTDDLMDRVKKIRDLVKD